MLATSSNPSNDNINTWLVQPKDDFKWNATQVLEWKSLTNFVNLAVSPLGNVYGVQIYSDKKNKYSWLYEYNFLTGGWDLWDDKIEVSDVRFDKVGRMYLLDPKGNVYGPGSNTTAILAGVSDFEVTVEGRVLGISTTNTSSPRAFLEGQWDKFADKLDYKSYSRAIYSKVTLNNQIPVFSDVNSKLVGFGFECVTDISSGADGSFWALDCSADKDGNFGILKWDPFRAQWYKISGYRGIKIGVFNEVSAAVLNK